MPGTSALFSVLLRASRYSFRRARAQFPDQDGNKLDVNNHSWNGTWKQQKRSEPKFVTVTRWALGKATLEKCSIVI